MKFRIDKSFDRDVDKIKDLKILRKLRSCISKIEKSATINELPHIKKIEGYQNFYRIRIGDYRLGIERTSNKEIILIRFLHRKDIYKYFPKK